MGLITLENVSKIYGEDVKALDNISLDIKEGEWVSIMGPSGSGKSTMLNLIGCMDTPSKGVVKIDGIDISELDKKELTKVRREKIGLVFQQFHLVPYLTAVENVMVAQYYHSMAEEEEARKALERVGLGHRGNHLPKELSGGEQQRVCIARALINYPKLILADEPTGNLDKENENIVLDLFNELHDQGHTIMMVTHDPKVGQLAERQINLDHGKLKDTPQISKERGLVS
ncbi:MULTISPECIES: ABC transporter ATP-binding protein [unclassified Candidatus Frackibacter]|uniref:ABC transporter ATP-binding protein n=1 Tax=unclassified Candidatus Frackibacter TaxID=2648818 RepID=UPI00087EA09D|nr:MULTISPECIES: ABC transporter ATP-binding protein [unclassified Candidatus Frackibacter]SDC11651.1 putative ABC transport system ATP-binding protein [Candidatus Frackibacter sp. WG11]SEM36343.1 putative ABC transport system ATP-binding protein [Candidatus Frackibacter sp. WG12]SFL41598.1 putative ABC transport system ATP-binding protein [Candidatus Frackibacter sp. WG13]